MEMTLDEIKNLIADKNFEQAREELDYFITKNENDIEALKLLGLCCINLDDFEQGRSVFETIVKYNPDDASSWFYLANCYDNLDDFLHAVPAYQKVLELRVNYLDAYKCLCIIYVKTKEPEKAVELGKKAVEISADDYTVFYIIGTAYMSMKNFQESLYYLEKALELNPNHAQLYNNLGTSYVTIGNLEKAYENFEKSAELDDTSSITFYNMGSILQMQNKHKEACEYFQKAYDLEPQDTYLVAMALSEVKSGDFENAIKHYKTLISLFPDKTNYQYNLAVCYEMLGKIDMATGILLHLVMLNPKSLTMSQKLANLFIKAKQYKKAKAIYERMVMIGNVSQELYYEFAHVCVLTNDMDKAEKILKKVIELNPDFAPAHKDLGVIYLSKRLFNYAKDEFEQALKSAPEEFDILFEYANYLHATTDFKMADEYYKKALEKQPHDVNALSFSALNKTLLNDLDNAWNEIEEAMKIAPSESFILYIAGKIKFLQHDYEEAKRFLISSYEKEQTSDIENILGLCYYELEDYSQANAIFENMLEKSPLNLNLLLNSARTCEKLGETDKALDKAEKIVSTFPECEEAQEMIRRLS